MPGSSRSVYGPEGRSTPYWLWVAQRASAILLGPLVLVHVALPQAPRVGWLGLLLLLVVLAHGLSGLWRLAAMRGVSHAAYQAACTVSILLTLALAALGLAVVASRF